MKYEMIRNHKGWKKGAIAWKDPKNEGYFTLAGRYKRGEYDFTTIPAIDIRDLSLFKRIK